TGRASRRRRRRRDRWPTPVGGRTLRISAGSRTSHSWLAGRWPLQLEALGDLAEDLAEVVDLLVGVGRRQLEAKSDFVTRDQRVDRHRDVDAAAEQQLADVVDSV